MSAASQVSVLAELDAFQGAEIREIAASTHSNDAIQALAKALLARSLWKWFLANADRRVKVKVWIFRPSVRIGELRELMELIFGAPPSDLGAQAA